MQTLTTGIFSVWLQGGNLGGAAQLATCVLIIIVFLVTLEKLSPPQKPVFHDRAKCASRDARCVEGLRLHGPATFACALPVVVGFVLPMAVLYVPCDGRWRMGGAGAASGRRTHGNSGRDRCGSDRDRRGVYGLRRAVERASVCRRF